MRVIINSMPKCPSCQLAKQYLKDNAIPFEEFVFDDVESRRGLYDRLGLVGKERTVPQIIVIEDDGVENRLGGWTDLLRSDLTTRYRDSMFGE